jgi:hypothetical protein
VQCVCIGRCLAAAHSLTGSLPCLSFSTSHTTLVAPSHTTTASRAGLRLHRLPAGQNWRSLCTFLICKLRVNAGNTRNWQLLCSATGRQSPWRCQATYPRSRSKVKSISMYSGVRDDLARTHPSKVVGKRVLGKCAPALRHGGQGTRSCPFRHISCQCATQLGFIRTVGFESISRL